MSTSLTNTSRLMKTPLQSCQVNKSVQKVLSLTLHFHCRLHGVKRIGLEAWFPHERGLGAGGKKCLEDSL